MLPTELWCTRNQDVVNDYGFCKDKVYGLGRSVILQIVQIDWVTIHTLITHDEKYYLKLIHAKAIRTYMWCKYAAFLFNMNYFIPFKLVCSSKVISEI